MEVFSFANFLGFIIVSLSVLHFLSPSVDEGIALIPHHTVMSPWLYCPFPYVWNVVTAHLFESNLAKAAIAAPWAVALTKMLERLWTVRALLSHIVCSTALSGFAVFAAQLAHMQRTTRYRDFFAPMNGCSGLLVALAVGLRHAYPFEALPLVPKSWGLQCQQLPFGLVVFLTALGLAAPDVLPEWPFAPLAFFFGWFHLRYVMWFPYAEASGDHSPEFAFAMLFPRPLQPCASCFSAIFYGIGSTVLPGCLTLREADGTLGHAIVYDPSNVHEPGDGAKGSEGTPGGNSWQYDARRAKAMALLDENIAALLGHASDVALTFTNKEDRATADYDVEAAARELRKLQEETPVGRRQSAPPAVELAEGAARVEAPSVAGENP